MQQPLFVVAEGYKTEKALKTGEIRTLNCKIEEKQREIRKKPKNVDRFLCKLSF